MLEVSLNFRDIKITNILVDDLSEIQKQIEYDEQFSLARLSERFLESYLSECEYFLKISKGDRLLGFIKGRVEFKNPNEAWVWFYHIVEGEEGDKLAAEVVEHLFCYLNREYDVGEFYIRVPLGEEQAINFWKTMGFKPLRLVKDFYYIGGQKMDMLILENKSMKFNAYKC
ncbi:MAG: GNAT family N-acetyltransferase [Clostridiaceae bacterium]